MCQCILVLDEPQPQPAFVSSLCTVCAVPLQLGPSIQFCSRDTRVHPFVSATVTVNVNCAVISKLCVRALLLISLKLWQLNCSVCNALGSQAKLNQSSHGLL